MNDQSTSVEDKDFYHCLDRLQDRLDKDAILINFEGEYVLHSCKEHKRVVAGNSIRELLVNLVMLDC